MIRNATLLTICAITAAAGLAALMLAKPGDDSAEKAASAEVAVVSIGPAEITHPEPATLPAGAAALGSGAGQSGPGGVPLRFAHSPDGAVAAGTDWLTVVEGTGVLDAERRPALLSAIGNRTFTNAASRRIAERAATLGLPDSGWPSNGYVTAVARPDRGAYRVLASSKNNARIEIWYPYQLAVLGDGAQLGAARWFRARAVLGWDTTKDDWRLTDDFTFEDGPDPGAQHPSFVQRRQVLSSYGSGWHLYAGAQE